MFTSHSLVQSIFNFIRLHHDPKRQLLLGLSGGPDSIALFHLLVQYRKQHELKFAVAHIDHGWRQESATEAKILSEIAQNFEVPFHLKTIHPSQLQGNLEAACRKERLKFFAELTKMYDYQAVLLGHHADDQAETVLKRVLEGANISNLFGLQQETYMDGITIWRPLLNHRKDEILSWLKENGIQFFHDTTNLDPKFLRSRLRMEIIPELSKKFGKEVSDNLWNLGNEAYEFKQYLNQTFEPYLKNIVKGPFGAYLDLSHQCPNSAFEVKYLLRELLRRENLLPSRDQVETACQLVISGKGNKVLQVGNRKIYIDRRKIFVLQDLFKGLQLQKLEVGSFKYGSWEVQVMSASDSKPQISGWENVWRGSFAVSLPFGDYQIGPAELTTAYPGKSSPISKWWTNEKVPAFLRECIPVIWQGNQIIHEFLTSRPKPHSAKHWLHITFKYD